jgi:hypothetical protein
VRLHVSHSILCGPPRPPPIVGDKLQEPSRASLALSASLTLDSWIFPEDNDVCLILSRAEQRYTSLITYTPRHPAPTHQIIKHMITHEHTTSPQFRVSGFEFRVLGLGSH